MCICMSTRFILPANVGQTLSKKRASAEIFVPGIWRVNFDKNIATISRETVIKYPPHMPPGFEANLFYGFRIFPSMCDELF